MAKKIDPQNQYSPVFASTSWDFNNEDEDNRQEWFRQFSNFPAWLKLGMADIEIDRETRRASIRIFGDEDLQKAGELSRIIRDIFLGRILKDRIPERLVKRVGLSEKDALKAKEEILRIVELIKKIGKEKELKVFDKLSIIMALKKYDNLGRQLISSEPLDLKTHNYPVAPNIKNWLEDYIQKMGAHSHTSIERSEYLFNSENGKKLDAQDRQRVSVILESYDKDTDLLIDKEEQKVVFDSSLEGSSNVKSKKENQSLSFSKPKKAELELETETNSKKSVKLEEESEKEEGEKEKSQNQKKDNGGISFFLQKKKDDLKTEKEDFLDLKPKKEKSQKKEEFKDQKQSIWKKDSSAKQDQKLPTPFSFQSSAKEKKAVDSSSLEPVPSTDTGKKGTSKGKNEVIFQKNNQKIKEESRKNFSDIKQNQAPSLSKLLENLQKKSSKKDFSYDNRDLAPGGDSVEKVDEKKSMIKEEGNSFQAENQKKAPSKERSLTETLEKLQKKVSSRDEKGDRDGFQKSGLELEKKSQPVNLKEIAQQKQSLKPRNVLDLKGILGKKEEK